MAGARIEAKPFNWRARSARAHEVIRVDAAWLAVEPLDMRAGVDKALARVVSVFGEARAHHAYLFINKRANRMKVLLISVQL